MVYVPTFEGTIAQWASLLFVVTSPLFFLGEATGWTSFGYSKFAKRERRFALPSRLGMLVIYAPAVVLVWLPLVLRGVEMTPWHLLVATLISLHFGKRCLEVLFVHRYSGVMNLGSVLLICSLYSSVSLLLGEVAATEVGASGMPTEGFELWLGIGLALWILGTVGNLHHHRLLAGLRTPGESGYKVPRGGLFGLVATPHYFLEVVGWWGFALVFHHVAAACIVWTMMLYLAGRAHNTRKWYRERMADQLPSGWKRMIPFVY
ncbi:MAG: DUF1295 domain-containing protein [Myxococcota bacterium]